jgi:protein tyrosine/serine phosphatase
MQYVLTQEEYDALIKAKELAEKAALEKVKNCLHLEIDIYNTAASNAIVEIIKSMSQYNPNKFLFDKDTWTHGSPR